MGIDPLQEIKDCLVKEGLALHECTSKFATDNPTTGADGLKVRVRACTCACKWAAARHGTEAREHGPTAYVGMSGARAPDSGLLTCSVMKLQSMLARARVVEPGQAGAANGLAPKDGNGSSAAKRDQEHRS